MAKPAKDMTCCTVEALVTVDERGQLVLPKELREKGGIKGGDKFLVVSGKSGGKVCCLFLMKAEEFADSVKGILEPIMKEITK
ncbi:MAG: HgcAB-associated protein [Chloroflexota bacterium]